MGDHGGERSFFDRVNSSSDYTSPIASDDPVTGSDNPYSAYAYPEQLHDGPCKLRNSIVELSSLPLTVHDRLPGVHHDPTSSNDVPNRAECCSWM